MSVALVHQGDYAPWLQLEGESNRGFHAFEHYRELGYKRTLDAAYRAHLEACTKKQSKGDEGASGSWTKWSILNGWVERATAWDRELDGARLAGVRSEAIEMGRRQAATAAEHQEVLSLPARTLLKALERFPETEEQLIEMSVEPGFLLGLLKLVKETASVLPALAKMEREALGVKDQLEPDEAEQAMRVTVEVHYDDGHPS